MPECEFPDHFPGAWQNLPIEVKRFLTARLLEKSLEIHEGSSGLIKFLYAGTDRPNGERLSYLRSGEECWAYVVQDTEAWLARRAKAAPAIAT